MEIIFILVVGSYGLNAESARLFIDNQSRRDVFQRFNIFHYKILPRWVAYHHKTEFLRMAIAHFQ